MAERICSVPGCERKRKCRGWCGKHYQRWLKHGDPTFVLVDRDATPAERFWAKVDKGDGFGCWLWTRQLDRDGYGVCTVNRRPVRAHRYAYMLLVGPIPDGLPLDHVKANGCTSKACVKAVADSFGPSHLEPVTNRANLLRGETFQARNAAKTHCPQGHPYDEANTYIRGGRRHCRACRRQR